MKIDIKGNRMFVLTTTKASLNPICFQMELEEESQLWHNRFGHLSYSGLKMLSSKQMLNGLPTVTVQKEIYTYYLTGKQHRKPISKKSLWKASNKLQLVHANICGPINPISSSNKRYILSFIDDFSRKIWLYFLNEKS